MMAHGNTSAAAFPTSPGIVKEYGVTLLTKEFGPRNHLLAVSSKAMQKNNGPFPIVCGNHPSFDLMIVRRSPTHFLNGKRKIYGWLTHRPGV